ncbi:hypothetical protein [Dyadobacter diqingensis]|uniref:hypothetical protein n=1 Tax=Dyadobacter diqingensis TaxID=2938121 RepID=UPI0020C5A914|nr:hypothetical protein [Dyadobacter diqingensis]
MPWNPDNDAVNGQIDSSIKDSPPNPAMINTAAVVRNALKGMWTVIRTQVQTAVTSMDAIQNNFITRSLTLNAVCYINATSGDDTKNGSTLALAVKTMAKAIQLYSDKAVNLTVYISGTVEIPANMALIATNIWFGFYPDGKIYIRKLPANNGNYCLWIGALNVQFMTFGGGLGIVETEGHGGNVTSLPAFDYNLLQGGIRLLKMQWKEWRTSFKMQMVGLNVMKLVAGANTTVFAAYEDGINPVAYNRTSCIFYDQMYSDVPAAGAAYDNGFNGNKLYIRNYTPVNSTDANVLEGETVSDNSWLFRKNGGVIKKIAWVNF